MIKVKCPTYIGKEGPIQTAAKLDMALTVGGGA